jgi:chromosome segregation ATPase
LEDENAELASTLARLQSELVGANERADETLRVVHEDFETKESQLRSTILALKEDLCSRNIQLEDSNNRSAQLKDQLREGTDERASLQEQHANLQVKLNAVGNDLEAQQRMVSQQADEIAGLRDTSSEVEKQLTSTIQKLEAVICERDQSQTRYLELVQTSEQDLQDVKAKAEDNVKVIEANAKQEHDRLYEDLQEALQDSQQAKTAYEETYRDLELTRVEAARLGEKVRYKISKLDYC